MSLTILDNRWILTKFLWWDLEVTCVMMKSMLEIGLTQVGQWIYDGQKMCFTPWNFAMAHVKVGMLKRSQLYWGHCIKITCGLTLIKVTLWCEVQMPTGKTLLGRKWFQLRRNLIIKITNVINSCLIPLLSLWSLLTHNMAYTVGNLTRILLRYPSISWGKNTELLLKMTWKQEKSTW